MRVKIEFISEVDYGDHKQNSKENYEGEIENNILTFSSNDKMTKILLKKDNFKIEKEDAYLLHLDTENISDAFFYIEDKVLMMNIKCNSLELNENKIVLNYDMLDKENKVANYNILISYEEF